MMESQHTQGRCLCGAVRFTLRDALPAIYQCHCSECRKITGSAHNASCIVPTDGFTWVQGEDSVTSYVHDSGYRSHFCSRCGSPAPNLMRNGQYFWVPAGALDDTGGMKVKAHLCVSSRASWEATAADGRQFDDVPPFDELISILGDRR